MKKCVIFLLDTFLSSVSWFSVDPSLFSAYPSLFPTAFVLAVIHLYLHSLMQQVLLHFGWQVRGFCGLLSITLSLLLLRSLAFNTGWPREQEDSSVGSNRVRLADRRHQLFGRNDFKLCRNQCPCTVCAENLSWKVRGTRDSLSVCTSTRWLAGRFSGDVHVSVKASSAFVQSRNPRGRRDLLCQLRFLWASSGHLGGQG